MPKILNIESFDSGLHPGFQHVYSIDLGEVLGEGSFGKVYICDSINGSPPFLPQVIKILEDNGTDAYRRGFDTIRKLQEKIIESNAQRTAAGRPRLESLPALRALPQFSFLGEMNGRQVLGYSATRLDTEGYAPLTNITEEKDPELREHYEALAIDERMLLATEMAEGFQALSEMSFVHADINDPNLLVNIGRCHIAIIDYDSGGVNGDLPTTRGKKGDWMAPEISEDPTAKIDPLTDRWGVFIGIHYLLLLYPPLFFFNTYVTSYSVEIYLRDHQWPDISLDHQLFNQDFESIYSYYLYEFGELPIEIKKELSSTLNKGFLNPAERTSCQQWASTLRAAIRGPEVLSFTASRGSVLASIPTVLSWSVSGAYKVSIDNGIGEVDSESSLEVYPAQTCVYTLTARTRHGESIRERLTVFVWPFPELRSIQIPSCSVEQRFSLSVLPYPLPSIDIPIHVDVGIHIREPSFRTQATAEIESTRARTPRRFPDLQPNGKRSLIAIFNQLKTKIADLAGAT